MSGPGARWRLEITREFDSRFHRLTLPSAAAATKRRPFLNHASAVTAALQCNGLLMSANPEGQETHNP